MFPAPKISVACNRPESWVTVRLKHCIRQIQFAPLPGRGGGAIFAKPVRPDMPYTELAPGRFKNLWS